MTLDRRQQLVLDVGEPGCPCLLLAPVLDTAQARPESQQAPEVLKSRLGRVGLPWIGRDADSYSSN